MEADFGHIHVDFPDGRRLVPFLVVVWAYSNAPFVMAMPFERTEAILEGLVAAFEFFQLMRLRAQHRREHAYGASHDDNPNEVELRLLSPLDRRILNESFRQARKVQQRLELDFPG